VGVKAAVTAGSCTYRATCDRSGRARDIMVWVRLERRVRNGLPVTIICCDCCFLWHHRHRRHTPLLSAPKSAGVLRPEEGQAITRRYKSPNGRQSTTQHEILRPAWVCSNFVYCTVRSTEYPPPTSHLPPPTATTKMDRIVQGFKRRQWTHRNCGVYTTRTVR
jgi:hypothetical protein